MNEMLVVFVYSSVENKFWSGGKQAHKSARAHTHTNVLDTCEKAYTPTHKERERGVDGDRKFQKERKKQV